MYNNLSDWDDLENLKMAAFSALKNRQNQKMREKLEDISIRCGDTGHGLEVSCSILLYRNIPKIN
jgi:hypothetical protein